MANTATIADDNPFSRFGRSYPPMKAGPGLFVQNGDHLYLALTTSDATGSVEFRGRHVNFEGSVTEFGYTYVFSGTGTQSFAPIPLTAGWLIGFDVAGASGTLTDGEVVASVHLARNAGALQQRLICLASGDVTSIRSLGMGAFTAVHVPATAAVTTTAIIAVADPAVATEWTHTVPAGVEWEVLWIYGRLTCDANVASRLASIIIDDGTNILWRVRNGTAVTASTALDLSAGGSTAQNTSAAASVFVQNLALPPARIPAGTRIRSSTYLIQAGDQWSAVRLTVRSTTV